MIQIYHNPRCSKSRQALEILKDLGENPEIILYLENPPTRAELASLIKKLGIQPEELIRKGEEIFKEKFKGKNFTDAEWIQILADNPKLIERPIVINKNKAIVARPPELAKEMV